MHIGDRVRHKRWNVEGTIENFSKSNRSALVRWEWHAEHTYSSYVRLENLESLSKCECNLCKTINGG